MPRFPESRQGGGGTTQAQQAQHEQLRGKCSVRVCCGSLQVRDPVDASDRVRGTTTEQPPASFTQA